MVSDESIEVGTYDPVVLTQVRDDEGILRGKVFVQGCFGDVGFGNDPIHANSVNAASRKQTLRGSQDANASVERGGGWHGRMGFCRSDRHDGRGPGLGSL